MKSSDHRIRAITAAKKWASADVLFFDTETSGIASTSEIVDLAFVDRAGKTIFESLIKPVNPIPAETTAIHGITNTMVANSPSFMEIIEPVFNLTAGKTVIAYNADFDDRMIVQSARAHGLNLESDKERIKCAMLLYALFKGDWNSRRNGYKWHKLAIAAEQCGIEVTENLHRARVDADLARKVFLHMVSQ